MKLKQLPAVLGLLILTLLVAYSISLLAPTETDSYTEADAELRGLVEDLYDLEPGVAGVYIRKQEGDFYLLELYADRIEGGGGHWSVMQRLGNSVREIEAGQYCAPSCKALTAASVPVSLITYCRTNDAEYETGIVDRASGKIMEDPTGYCL
ncbi:MAG: hypothetical protein AAB582_00565 [Patescibacteria group bacterium]